MDNEVKAHGQSLSGEFLDKLFVSIVNDIPDRKWVEIRKNHDQVIAGIKHIIDMDCYGENIEIVFNSDYTHFKKRIIVESKPHPFKDKFITNLPESFWKEQDRIQLEHAKREYIKQQNAEKNEGYKRRKSGRKR